MLLLLLLPKYQSGANTYMQQLLPLLRSSAREVVEYEANRCKQNEIR
jgi:hypothetical protein